MLRTNGRCVVLSPKVLFQNRIRILEINDCLPGTVDPIAIIPVSTTDGMLETLHVAELCSNVTTWCLTVAVYGALPEDGIEALEDLRRESDRRTKATDILNKVLEQMKLWLL